MSEAIVINTFYNPNFPGLLVIPEDVLDVLTDTLEAHGFEVINNKQLSPDYFDAESGEDTVTGGE